MSEENEPVGVQVGVGGDPLILGLPVFAVGSVALGMGLLGMPAGLGVVAPYVIITTGFFQIIVTLWAILLGISIVAAIFGLFSGFWLTLGIILIGTTHGWFGIDDVGAALQLFFIADACLFFFLTIACLRLPVMYPLIVALVTIALILAALGLFKITGIVALVFAFLGFWSWLNVAGTAMGSPNPWPPLGKPLVS